MAKKGYPFEAFIRSALIDFFVEYHIPAYVRREYQNIPNFIGTDITVDSSYPAWNMAIECKSRANTNKVKPLEQFSLKDLFKDGQLERIKDYLYLSGKRGYLAIEARKRPKNKHYVVRVRDVWEVYARGTTSIKVFDPKELPRPIKKNEVIAKELVKNEDGIYNMNECFLW